jgi:hypothetical protein
VRRDELPPELAHMPICTHRELPIPYIAEVDLITGAGHFTVLDPGRQRECYAKRLCAMCGLPMTGEVALIGDVVSLDPGGFYIEPPVHERCGELALGGLCPFLSHERVPRRPFEQDGTIQHLGDVSELLDVGRTLAKRPTLMGIYRQYKMAFHGGATVGNAMPVFLGGGLVRARRWDWQDGRATEVPGPGCPAAPPSPQRASGPRTQPRRASRAKRQAGGRHERRR